MKARLIFLGVMLLTPFCEIAIPAQTQTTNPQQALNQYVAELQSSPNDTALRGKIIALAQTMRPAPAIPEEARGHYVMATTFAEKAKSDTERTKDSSDLKLASAGFERAVAEYKAALLAAPWWADAYKKLAIAQKAAGEYDDAIASLNLYLLTQPADARDAQDEIYKLKALKQSVADDQVNQATRQQEEQQRQREEQQRAYAASAEGRFQALIKKIDGWQWRMDQDYYSWCMHNYIEIHGRVILRAAIYDKIGSPEAKGCILNEPNGHISYVSRALLGDVNFRFGPEYPCTGTISEDGEQIVLTYPGGRKESYSRVESPVWTIRE